MSDSENDLITSDYFSENTPQSCKSLDLDHKYCISPTNSLTSHSSHKSYNKTYKRRRLFTSDSVNAVKSKATPLSERQQLALALQLSANQSNSDSNHTQIAFNQTKASIKGFRLKNNLNIRRNHKGETDLHIAAIKGDLNRVKHIIAHNKHYIQITDFAGWSALHEACNRGYITIVEELLKAGADVNAKGYNGFTPLIDASVNGHYNLVQLLLRYGADYSLTNSFGKSALELAKSDKVIAVINWFIDEKMRKNGGNKDRDIVSTCVSKSRASSPSSCSSPSKPTSPRLTLRFQTIREKSTGMTSTISHTQSPSSSTMTSTKSYSVSTTIDKDKDTSVEPSFTDKQNDNNNKIITSNGSSLDAVSASSDHNYTSIDSSLMAANDEGSRGRKRRKSNDGSVSSTSVSSAGPLPSRSSSTSSVASSTQQSSHNKKHHHNHHHHHHVSHVSHHSSKTNNNNNTNIKDKLVKKLYSSSSDSESVEASEAADKDTNKDANNQTSNSATTSVSNSSSEGNAPKVPPLRIVLPANTSNTPSTVCVTTSSNGGTQSFVSSTVTSTTCSSAAKFPYVVSSSDETFQCESDSVSGSIGSQRITRSSQRVAQQQSQKSGSVEHQSDSEESSVNASSLAADSQHPRKRKIRNNNTNDNRNNVTNMNANNSVSNNPNSNCTTANHNNKEGDNDVDSCSSSSSVNGVLPSKDISPFALPSTNCYKMFLSIRKHVDKKRKEMFSVQPKAPQGFKDYLLNRCSYILEGKVSTTRSNGSGSTNSKPTLNTPPISLSPGSAMFDVFCEQEKQRNKLKTQHLIERDKLVLSAEQEILRVHGRAARAMANQNIPFSACSILKDEEIYNILEAETDQNETISNQLKVEKPVVTGLSGRTRYNGRLFLSWLQDVDDKWEKIKESMILRHRKESESLLAMQRLEWEWKLKELGLCDVKTNPTIDDKYVPAVHISDDFDLIPA